VDPQLAFAQKAALQRVEEIIGHVTAKEKGIAEREARQPGPLIVLPPGSAVMFAPIGARPIETAPKLPDASERRCCSSRADTPTEQNLAGGQEIVFLWKGQGDDE
jgi:hypothetical protein